MSIEVKTHNHEKMTVVSVSGDSEAVSEIGMDIHDNGTAWAIVGWKGKGKSAIWEYFLPTGAQSTLIHLLTTQSMGKTAWHIKRIAEEARQLGGQS